MRARKEKFSRLEAAGILANINYAVMQVESWIN